MRGAAVTVVLLLCLHRARCDDGGAARNINRTDMQSKGGIQGPEGLAMNFWAELRELRDMVIEHKVELNHSTNKMEFLQRENAGEAHGTAAAQTLGSATNTF